MTTPIARARRIGRRLAPLALAALVVVIVVVVLQLAGASDRRRIDDVARDGAETAEQTHAALCTFKLDYVDRLADAERYRAEIEAGVRPLPPGITLRDVDATIAARRATVKSLRDLDCRDQRDDRHEQPKQEAGT